MARCTVCFPERIRIVTGYVVVFQDRAWRKLPNGQAAGCSSPPAAPQSAVCSRFGVFPKSGLAPLGSLPVGGHSPCRGSNAPRCLYCRSCSFPSSAGKLSFFAACRAAAVSVAPALSPLRISGRLRTLAGGTGRGAGSLARRCGPVVGAGLSSSESLSVPSAPWGPGAPSACALRVRHGRVPLASVARLIRPRCPRFFARPRPFAQWPCNLLGAEPAGRCALTASSRLPSALTAGKTLLSDRPGCGRIAAGPNTVPG